MFKTCLSVLKVIVCCWIFSGCDTETKSELRVLTFNIHHGETIAGAIDLETMAAVINSAKPDLVALQEVDVRTGRVGGVDLAAKFGELCGMESYFAKAMDYDGGEYGNAVLSKYPIVESDLRKLPSTRDHEPRVAAECLIALPNDTIRFISTHFDHMSDRPDRPAQARTLLLAYINDTKSSILAGDLNDTPDSETLKILQQHWAISGATNAFSSPADAPQRKIDYILYAPQDTWQVVHSEVLPAAVSDHLAVLSVFQKGK